MRKQEILERLRSSGALGIIRVQTSSDLVRVAAACREVGGEIFRGPKYEIEIVDRVGGRGFLHRGVPLRVPHRGTPGRGELRRCGIRPQADQPRGPLMGQPGGGRTPPARGRPPHRQVRLGIRHEAHRPLVRCV